METVRNKLSYVQVSRAIAILFVLIGHVNAEFYVLYGYDWFDLGEWRRTGGVDFFFIVTGFMIYFLYHKHIGTPEKAPEFLMRRAIRILPLYWIFTIFAVLIVYFVPGAGGDEYSVAMIVKSLIFLENEPVIGAAWSMKHILFFYLLFAALIYRPQVLKPLIALWVIVTVMFELEILHFQDSFLFSFSSLEVIMGALVAYIGINFKVRCSTFSIVLGVLGFLAVWINSIHNLYDINASFFYCLFSMFIMLGIGEKDKNPQKTPKLLSFLGDASYSIYIAHGPILSFYIIILGLTGLVDITGESITMISVILLTTATCCAVYQYIEKPLNKYLRQKILQPKTKPGEHETIHYPLHHTTAPGVRPPVT